MRITPFYSLALNLFKTTQERQIQKGKEKYPEPFNPRSWTPQELLNHALEETVDLTHYLVGLKVLLDDRDQEICVLRRELHDLRREQTSQADLNTVFNKPPYADLDD